MTVTTTILTRAQVDARRAEIRATLAELDHHDRAELVRELEDLDFLAKPRKTTFPRCLVWWDDRWGKWQVYYRTHNGQHAEEGQRVGSSPTWAEAVSTANTWTIIRRAEMALNGQALRHEENNR